MGGYRATRRLFAPVVSIILLVLGLILGLGLASTATAGQERRIALLIANADYPSSVSAPLTNTAGDVQAIHDALLKVGFKEEDIFVKRNQTRVDIIGDLDALGDLVANNDDPENTVVFFYYSGHGGALNENGKRINYILPVDGTVSDVTSLKAAMVPNGYILDALGSLETKATYAIFDACRSEFKIASTKAGIGGADGSGFLEVGRDGIFVMYATGEGHVTPDDGLFAESIANNIVKPQTMDFVAFQYAIDATTALRKDSAEAGALIDTVRPVMFNGLGKRLCFVSCPQEPAEISHLVSADYAPLYIAPSPTAYKLFPYLPKTLPLATLASEPVTAGGVNWRHVETDFDGANLNGYVRENDIALVGETGESTESRTPAELPNIMTVDVEQIDLRKLAQRMPAVVKQERANAYLKALVLQRDVLGQYGIDTPLRFEHFFAQIAYESSGFRALVENMNYSAQGLMRNFPKRVTSQAIADQAVAGGKEAIAELIYGGRLGNVEPGDGYRYLGRGFIFIRGRSNYQLYSDLLGLDLINHPELLEQPDVAVRAAAAYWKAQDNISAAADRDDVEAVTRLINGGTVGLDDRRRWTEIAKSMFEDMSGSLLDSGTATHVDVRDSGLIRVVKADLQSLCLIAPDATLTQFRLDAVISDLQTRNSLTVTGKLNDETLVLLAGSAAEARQAGTRCAA